MEPRLMVSVRIRRASLDKIKSIATEAKVDQSTVLREALNAGLVPARAKLVKELAARDAGEVKA